MKTKLKNTDHFLKRLWSRGFYLSNIEKLTQKLIPQKEKTLFIYSCNVLRGMNIQIERNYYLVVVVKKDVLVTLFTISNIYEYLRANKSTKFKIIQSI